MQEVVIVSAVRSPVAKGKKDGALANVHAVDLSAHLMKAAIERAGGNKAAAARLLGITRRRLYSMLQSHGREETGDPTDQP